MPERRRCAWAESSALMRSYHDREWGVPLHDDRRLFELLILEGAQAGLSWATVLNKRAAYRKAFHGFRPRRVAAFGPREVKRLLADPGIVRNRLKVEAAIANATLFLAVRTEWGTFDRYLWSFVEGKPRQPGRRKTGVPARTPDSDRLSEDLRRRGFKFVGSTIVYAYMQAAGLVNDHSSKCFRRRALRTPSPARAERRERGRAPRSSPWRKRR